MSKNSKDSIKNEEVQESQERTVRELLFDLLEIKDGKKEAASNILTETITTIQSLVEINHKLETTLGSYRGNAPATKSDIQRLSAQISTMTTAVESLARGITSLLKPQITVDPNQVKINLEGPAKGAEQGMRDGE